MKKKHAWPQQGIKADSDIKEYTWGYLIEEDGKFVFDVAERPTDEEIRQRWSCYLKDEEESSDLKENG